MIEPIKATGGFCAPVPPEYDFFAIVPRVIPATFVGLADLWSDDIRAMNEQIITAKPKQRVRISVRIAEYAKARRAILHGPLQGAGELVQWADLRVERLVQYNADHPEDRKRFRKIRYARIGAARTIAREMRKCANGGGEVSPTDNALPLVTVPRGEIRFITPPVSEHRSPNIDAIVLKHLLDAVGGDEVLAESLLLFAKSEGERLRQLRNRTTP